MLLLPVDDDDDDDDADDAFNTIPPCIYTLIIKLTLKLLSATAKTGLQKVKLKLKSRFI